MSDKKIVTRDEAVQFLRENPYVPVIETETQLMFAVKEGLIRLADQRELRAGHGWLGTGFPIDSPLLNPNCKFELGDPAPKFTEELEEVLTHGFGCYSEDVRTYTAALLKILGKEL